MAFWKKKEITRRMFRAQRSPRRGSSNPERMDMPVWEWLVRQGISAYEANEKFKGPDVFEAGPGWCFDRFGRSETKLEDGRIVHVAGEHEDGYDPDFYIYNDVIVRHPDDSIEIYGYPVEVFPPTDFHTATLVGSEIWIVGSLSYPEDRRPGTTPVFVLALEDLSIRRVDTKGDLPGWIHRHEARREDDAIVITRGLVEGPDAEAIENVDDFALDLRTREWTRRTVRPFQQWAIRREDGESLMLFDMSCAAFEEDYPISREEVEKSLPDLSDLDVEIELDSRRRLEKAGRRYEKALYEQLFVPSVAHEPVETEELETRMRIDGALVRFGEVGSDMAIKIEGALDDDVVQAVVEDFVEKLETLQDAPCEATLGISSEACLARNRSQWRSFSRLCER